ARACRIRSSDRARRIASENSAQPVAETSAPCRIRPLCRRTSEKAVRKRFETVECRFWQALPAARSAIREAPPQSSIPARQFFRGPVSKRLQSARELFEKQADRSDLPAENKFHPQTASDQA